MARSPEEQTNSLAAYLPQGRAFAAKHVEGSVTRGLLAGLSGELIRNAELIEEFRQEILPDETILFVDEWERAVGIPDACFTGSGTVAERRADVLAKLTSLGVQTSEDMRLLALLVYGVELTIVNPPVDTVNVFPYTFNPTGEPDPDSDGGEFNFGLSNRESRFQIVIRYDNLPISVRFPYTFPIPFLTREVAVIECLFAALRPANVGFTQEIPVPSESPAPTPEPVGFEIQTMSLENFETEGELTQTTAGLTGFVDDFSIGIWAKNTEASPGGVDTMFALREFANKNAIEIGANLNSADDLRIFISDETQTTRQQHLWSGVIDGDTDTWHHYIVTWDGLVSGLKMYIDGVLTAPSSTTTNLDSSTIEDDVLRQYFIGGRNTGAGDRWEGPIYSVSVWNKVLDATEVAAAYNGGNGRDMNLDVNEGAYQAAGNHQDFFRLGIGSALSDFGLDRGADVTDRSVGGTTHDSGDLTADIPEP